MKIIFLSSTPIPRHFFNMLNISEFIKLNLNIEIWNLESLFFEKDLLNSYYKDENLKVQHKNLKKIYNFQELDDSIKNNKSSFFIHLTKYNQMIDDSVLIKKLNENKINYSICNFDPVKSFYSLKQLIKFPLNLFRRKLRYKNLFPNYVITSGNIGVEDSKKFFPNANVVSIPSIKIKWKKSLREINNNYVCFIDENINYSPDSKLLKQTFCNNVDDYYKNINLLLDKIEDWFSIQIVICTKNENNNIEKKNNFYENRTVISGKTLELIQHSNFIIGHGSLAIDQAIASKKHVLIINDKNLTNFKRRPWARYDYFLKNKRINSDEIIKRDIDNLLSSDLEYYDKYIEDYLKQRDVTENFAKIISNFI